MTLSMRLEFSASVAENVFHALDCVADRFLVVGHELVHVLQHRARSFGEILARVGIGVQRQYAVLVRLDLGRIHITALHRDRGDAGQALKLEADLRVLAHRRLALDTDHRHDRVRVVDLDGGDFADADTVEIHVGAGAQPSDGAIEHDAIADARLRRAHVLKPDHEAEDGRQHRQRKAADQRIIRPCFHILTPD